jgi:hypothetical protein
MRPNDIDTQLKQRPFVPFRIHLSEGCHYDIRHPEMLLISRTVLAIAVYDDPSADRPARIVMCDPVHVTRLEPINGKVASTQ